MHHYGKVRDEQRVEAKQQLYLQLGLKKVEEDSSNGKAFFDLAIQYQELGRHAEACPIFRQSFEMTRRPLALLYWALSEKHLRNYTAAEGLLRKAISLGLDTFHIHLELGNVHLAQNEWREAEAEYTHCLSLNPDNAIAAFNHGLALRKMGETDRAANAYERALTLDPKFREPALELAVLHLQARRPDEALSALEPFANGDAVVLSLVGRRASPKRQSR
jgi:tetratricopeptide (TPR) repeat protein